MSNSASTQRDLVFLDTETTGFKLNYHEVIDIWAIRMRPRLDGHTISLAPVAEAGGRVKPRHPHRAHPKALKVNGYTLNRWASSEPWSVVWNRVAPVVDDAIIVGSNPSFDVGFINAMLRREQGQPRRLKTKYVVDTASIAHPLKLRGLVQSAGISGLVSFFHINTKGMPEHTARGDVLRTIEVYKRLMGMRSCSAGRSIGGEECGQFSEAI